MPLGDQQQRFILVVLLLHANKPVSPERLTEIVWPDQPEPGTSCAATSTSCATRSEPTDVVSRRRRPATYCASARTSWTPSASTGCARKRRSPAGPRPAPGDRPAARRGRAVARAVPRGHRHRPGRRRRGDLAGRDLPDAVGDLAELELVVGDHRSARDRLRRAVDRPASQKYAELLMRALIAGGDRVGGDPGVPGRRGRARRARHRAGNGAAQPRRTRAEHGEPVSSLPSRPGAFTGRDGRARRRSSQRRRHR